MSRRTLLVGLALALPLVAIAGVALALTSSGGGGDTTRQPRLDPKPTSTFPDATQASASGLRLELERADLEAGTPGEVAFRVVRENGQPLGELDVWQDRRLHAFLVRKDLAVFARVDVAEAGEGRWSGTVDGLEPGPYRLVVDFTTTAGRKEIALGEDVEVPGAYGARPGPAPDAPAEIGGGRQILVGHRTLYAREDTIVSFTLADDRGALELEPYLDGRGFAAFVHEETLAYVHGHPRAGRPEFATSFAQPGRWRAFFEYRQGRRTEVAALTIEVNDVS